MLLNSAASEKKIASSHVIFRCAIVSIAQRANEIVLKKINLKIGSTFVSYRFDVFVSDVVHHRLIHLFFRSTMNFEWSDPHIENTL